MSRMDARSLLLQLKPELHRKLSLPMREHDGTRLPVSKLRPGFQVIQEFRNQLRLAEEMVAKLGFQLRELQILKAAPRVSPRGSSGENGTLSTRESLGKVLRLRRRISQSSAEDESESDKF